MYENKKTLKDLDLNNKKVIVRFDFNVPIKDGVVTDDKRIVAAIPTIKYLFDKNCCIVGLSHLSRIKTLDDIKSNKKSLAPVAKKLQELLPNNKVIFEPSLDYSTIKQKASQLQSGQILLLENTRYYDVDDKNTVVKFESKNNSDLAKFWASLADCFVNDAFGTVHRAHASNVGIAQNIKDSCIGFLIEKEINSISQAIENPKHPYMAILGGAKVSDKIKVISNLLPKVDKILICGGMAYTFLAAQGYDVGKSICELEMYDFAKEILEKGKDKILLTTDAYCNNEFVDTPGKLINIQDGFKNLEGLDIGEQTIKLFDQTLDSAKTVVWNGPCGVFEFKNYQKGTNCLAKKLAEITTKGCYTLIGGGDSAAAIKQLGYKEEDYSFISTGGGACLSLIEGSPLPGIEAIADRR
ncbi:MAG: phosphoglycerate kinase [Mycoplasma sp.]|nr:phosphoglycerate kinase [Mycoplasma sp.]